MKLILVTLAIGSVIVGLLATCLPYGRIARAGAALYLTGGVVLFWAVIFTLLD